jgi:transcriptional regulator with XRE-family HTH domain
MAKLKVGKPLSEGAPKAAARVTEATATARASVAETAQTLGDYLRDQRRGAQLTLRQLADQAGVSNPYLSQIERGLRRPSADVLQQLAKALRISAETLYIRAGILDPDERGSQSVQSAVLADPELSERQKQVLLEVYASFRRISPT